MMQRLNFTPGFSRLTKSALATGALLLLATGCAASGASGAASDAPSVSSSSAAAATAAPISTPTMSAPALPAEDPYGWPLVASTQAVKAGDTIRVTGGTLPPGEEVKVYAAKLMAMPSYDAANDMYHQVGEQIPISETISAVTDAEGKYSLDLLIPAGTVPQEFDLILSSADGNGNLIRGSVR